MDQHLYRSHHDPRGRYEMHEGALAQARLLRKLGLDRPSLVAGARQALSSRLELWKRERLSRRSARHALKSVARENPRSV